MDSQDKLREYESRMRAIEQQLRATQMEELCRENTERLRKELQRERAGAYRAGAGLFRARGTGTARRRRAARGKSRADGQCFAVRLFQPIPLRRHLRQNLL